MSADPTTTADLLVRSGSLQVAFVVPARNEQRHLERCLRSILTQDRAEHQSVETSLIVVDNQSTDDTCQIADRLGAKVLSVQPGKPGRARNVGVAATDADFIVFVDADCVLPPTWLAHCLKHFADDQVVAVGSTQAAAEAQAPWVERVWVHAIIPKSNSSWERVQWLPAFNMMVRKSEFDAVGGFDESLQTCEDSDLSFRLSQKGELRRDHRVPVQHLGESRSLGEFFRREMWRSGGNFQSAIKRRAWMAELPSLLLPMVYLLLLCLGLVCLLVAIASGGVWWWILLGILAILAVVPTAIAFRKVGTDKLPSTTALLAVYLVARGIGPMLGAKRVSR